MQTQNMQGIYRKDIEALRALAVTSVLLFHLGYLPNGYLGVDVFFVISGYLITRNIYTQTCEGDFSLSQFYIRRIRRIVPLVLLINIVALAVGYFVMLPNDLENVSEAVIATNFFSNNVLQYLTVKDYWSTATKFMPLMHTWSLGIEEQFYLIYPLFFLLFKRKLRWLVAVLLALTVGSVILYATSPNALAAFYFITTRFFELAAGGLAAIFLANRVVVTRYKPAVILLLVFVLCTGATYPAGIKLIVMCALSVCMVVTKDDSKICTYMLENKVIVFIGKISFSLYMWHQLVLAFTRYFILDSYNYIQAIGIVAVILVFSVATYFFIEQVFRNKNKVPNKLLLISTGSMFVIINIAAFYIYMRSGVVRDVPELGITAQNVVRNLNASYNDRIYKYDHDFNTTNKIKVLVLGHSYARDWANVILESEYKNSIDLSYSFDIYKAANLEKRATIKKRAAVANYIFITSTSKKDLDSLATLFTIDITKVHIIGVKKFGTNNGIFYNKKHDQNYCMQRVAVNQKLIDANNVLLQEWGDKYIDFIGTIADKNGTVPVFTPNCKFISHDCVHLTPAGASYYADIFTKNKVLQFKK